MPKPSALLAVTVAFLSACSPASVKNEPVPPPEPVTGLHALAQMFSQARNWSPDVRILRVLSLQIGDIKPLPGKAPVWQATFVSATRGQARTYTYSVSDISTSVREGIFPDQAMSFSGSSQNAQPFLIQAAKKDTDELYDIALKHAKEYDERHPGTKINYLLELNNRSPNAAWRVMWGASPSNAGFSVLIDATTGTFLEALN
jgi:hypothetical protein